MVVFVSAIQDTTAAAVGYRDRVRRLDDAAQAGKQDGEQMQGPLIDLLGPHSYRKPVDGNATTKIRWNLSGDAGRGEASVCAKTILSRVTTMVSTRRFVLERWRNFLRWISWTPHLNQRRVQSSDPRPKNPPKAGCSIIEERQLTRPIRRKRYTDANAVRNLPQELGGPRLPSASDLKRPRPDKSRTGFGVHDYFSPSTHRLFRSKGLPLAFASTGYRHLSTLDSRPRNAFPPFSQGSVQAKRVPRGHNLSPNAIRPRQTYDPLKPTDSEPFRAIETEKPDQAQGFRESSVGRDTPTGLGAGHQLPGAGVAASRSTLSGVEVLRAPLGCPWRAIFDP
ncbi:hypothetical protein QBC37DRAFT_399598 [Rhypophila decipiens]|uniref:Uncharacterized protein n=1 Tax=Rhypophila decipiens TaxID=261697 RepID=A0AAN7BB19_9PEZI|nr:hypothetical protein QBC37DRAFT_399598 [Rhypophila decipiens]